jgi:hypothetical protein
MLQLTQNIHNLEGSQTYKGEKMKKDTVRKYSRQDKEQGIEGDPNKSVKRKSKTY